MPNATHGQLCKLCVALQDPRQTLSLLPNDSPRQVYAVGRIWGRLLHFLPASRCFQLWPQVIIGVRHRQDVPRNVCKAAMLFNFKRLRNGLVRCIQKCKLREAQYLQHSALPIG